MNLLEAERFFEADAAGFGGLNEAEVAQEKDAAVEDVFAQDAGDLSGKKWRKIVAKVFGKSGGADYGPIVELDFVWARALELALALEGCDLIEEDWLQPRLGDAFGLLQSDDIGGSFFDDVEAFELKLAEDGGFAGAGGASEDVAGHG